MTRPAPNLSDGTPEESFLAAIANPWRRELVAWCVTPKTQREVFREFVCAGKKQRYTGLAGLVEGGWLREPFKGYYTLNPAAPLTLSHLIGITVGQSYQAYEEETACDAAVAALRRTSCRRMVGYLEAGPASPTSLMDFSGIPRADAAVSLTTLENALTVRKVDRVIELTRAGFPALEGWLDRISSGAPGVLRQVEGTRRVSI